jgi:endogenous inhibitor of DNA gyrase (YacG/DUF329 family)
VVQPRRIEHALQRSEQTVDRWVERDGAWISEPLTETITVMTIEVCPDCGAPLQAGRDDLVPVAAFVCGRLEGIDLSQWAELTDEDVVACGGFDAGD